MKNFTSFKSQSSKWVLLCFILFITGSRLLAQSGGTGTNVDPFQIANLNDLYWIADQVNNQGNDFSGKFIKQTADIDASSTSSGAGWVAIGAEGSGTFSGSYDGQGYTISNLYINNPTGTYCGLFGYCANATIKNLGVTNVSIIAGDEIGGLAGYMDAGGTISNCYVTGTITSSGIVGGLCGESFSDIDNCYANCTITDGQKVGGLLGMLSGATLSHSYALGSITTSQASYIGGLVGGLQSSTGNINSCFSSCTITINGELSGKSFTGGFVGYIFQSALGSVDITNCYATGSISGNSFSAESRIGGFIGENTSTVNNCYAAVSMPTTGVTSLKGGFVGENHKEGPTDPFHYGIVNNNCYWNSDVYPTGCGENTGATFSATGKTTAEMQITSTYSGWNFTTPWDRIDTKNNKYPYLVWQTTFSPNLATTSVSTYGATSATVGGNVTDAGGVTVTETGVVYSSTNTNPVIGGTGVTKTVIGSGTGSFNTAIGSLTSGTLYHVQAYAINSVGISYGGVESFTTLVAAPTVTGISPTNGPTAGGTTVTITGTNLTAATAVNFGGTAGSVTANTATSITVTSPAGSVGTVDITVTTAGGTSATSSSDQFTYVAAPTVTGISPTNGPTAGGTTVTITGTNLTAASTVMFGSTNATGFTVNSATQITATAPAGAAGAVDITVTTAGGTSATSASDRFTYVAAPTVTSISPVSGPLASGTSVVITGTNFSGATAVMFGSTNAINYIVNSATQITATSPAGSVGTVDVTVTTTGGISTTSSSDQFTYVAAPTVTGISPAAGLTVGGTSVIITGANFTGVSAVSFGGTAASGYSFDSDTQITATAPAGSVGIVDITVTTTGGTSATSSADQFKYAVVPGSPTAVSASTGSGQATVSFTAPVSNGGSAITGYTVTSSPGGLTGSGSTSPIIVSGLTNGTTYTFTVTATNSVGTSSASAASSAVTPATISDIPTGISASAGNGQATVSFTAPVSNGGSAITGYTVTSSPGGLTGSGSSSPIIVSGLTNGTAYTFTVTATNGVGTSAPSAVSNSVTPNMSQSITFNALPTKTYGDVAYNLTATSDAGLTVSYSSDNTDVATISGTTLTIVGAGTANITASQAGNATYTAATNVIQQLTVERKALSVTAVADTKTYDGTTVSTAIPTVGTLATGDAINVAPTQVFDNAGVGTTHVLTASGLTIKRSTIDYAPAFDKVSVETIYKIRRPDVDVTGNYDISYVTATGTINKKAVTVTAATDTKFYDGTTNSVIHPVVGTLVTGDVIDAAPTQVFDNASAGPQHILTASGLTIKNGTVDATGNYDINYVSATGTIDKLPIKVRAVTDIKTYDGTTASTATPTIESVSMRTIMFKAAADSKTDDGTPVSKVHSTEGPLASGDVINTAPIQAFDNATVGTTHVLTASGLTIKNGSTDVTGNYDISYASATGTINKLGITVTAVADTKTYDGTTVSAVVPTVGTLATGDAINVAPTQVFDNASVGTTHVLTASGLTIKNGTVDATGNYDISYATAAGTINKKAVTVTAVTDTKTYDGTTVSAVVPTVGTLATGDAVNVAPAQVFDNASVGTTHVLTASGLTIKNGTVDATGNYDISYTTATGSITAKALTITTPAVTLSKVHDGNTLAAVTAGTLSGVVAGDAGKVTVAASASYDNATVGTNKTITVTYTLGGSSARNYSAPANYIATGAEIYSATIVLQPLSDPTPNPANTGFVLSYSVVTGGPTQYQITFETRAVSVGFQNVSYTALATTGTDGSISITVPKGTRPGKYKGTLKMRNDSGVESTAYDFVITVNIPTEYIVVKYNRVLVLDNSTRIFKAYQWFKNGVAIEGATKQFYRDPKGLVGTYSMQATDIDGEIIYSFPKELNIPIAQKVTAYPSLVRANQTCTVEITDEAMELDLKGAELSVYSSQGIRVYHSTNVEKLNTVKLPAMDGTYSGRVTTTDGQSFLFKVIVAN